MSRLRRHRTASWIVACLVVGQGSGGRPTERGQDKSRRVRPGRTAEKRPHGAHFSQRANSRDTLHFREMPATSTIDAHCREGRHGTG